MRDFHTQFFSTYSSICVRTFPHAENARQLRGVPVGRHTNRNGYFGWPSRTRLETLRRIRGPRVLWLEAFYSAIARPAIAAAPMTNEPAIATEAAPLLPELPPVEDAPAAPLVPDAKLEAVLEGSLEEPLPVAEEEESEVEVGVYAAGCCG